MILLSCSKQFVPQPSQTKIQDMNVECQNLVNLVNEKWFKHQKYPCHKEFPEAFTLANHYQKCLINLNKSDVLRIFGEPDIMSLNRYEYTFRKNCGRKKSLDYSSLILLFSNDLVVKAESELHSIIE
jgi:hypothetical protein